MATPEYNKKYYQKHKDKQKNSTRIWKRAHAIEVRAQNAKWRKENPTYRVKYDLHRKYGITLEQREKLAQEQGGKCAICCKEFNIKVKMVVDHNHSSNKIRGLLCDPCNLALGLFGDNTANLQAAINYLTKES